MAAEFDLFDESIVNDGTYRYRGCEMVIQLLERSTKISHWYDFRIVFDGEVFEGPREDGLPALLTANGFVPDEVAA